MYIQNANLYYEVYTRITQFTEFQKDISLPCLPSQASVCPSSLPYLYAILLLLFTSLSFIFSIPPYLIWTNVKVDIWIVY